RRLIAVSNYTAGRFRDANAAFDAVPPVDVCPLGIGDATSTPPPADGNEPIALIVSRLSSEDRYKGHDALIDAWPSVLAQTPDAVLVIVGDGDDRPRLEERVAERGVAHAVRFAGRVSDDELDRWYRRCAFLALPSVGEGFGLVLLEAM